MLTFQTWFNHYMMDAGSHSYPANRTVRADVVGADGHDHLEFDG
jgi:hypothetical protein